MKIAWFTPFSKKSAIGKYSKIATESIKNQFEVDIWVNDTDDVIETDLKLIKYSPNSTNLTDLTNYDIIFYNMGNYIPFHRDIYEVSRKYNGVIVLHDYIMHHFFAGYYLECLRNPQEYVYEMKRIYGVNGEKAAIECLSGEHTQIWESNEITHFPFFEKAIEGAMGVITHSKFLADKVRNVYKGPVATIYFPFNHENNNPSAVSRYKKNDFNIEEDKFLLLSFGHVNPNKRIDKVIKAIGENQQIADKVIYVIIGPYDKSSENYLEIQRLIKKYNLSDIVKFMGYQNDELLQAYMEVSDVFVNLRYPATEGASWSLLEQMFYGKPIIVTNTGFYEELPDDCLVKIPIKDEEKELSKVLKGLIIDKSLRNEVGLKAKKFADENFNTVNYSNRVIKFTDNVALRKSINNLIDKVCQELDIMGIVNDMCIIDRVCEEIYVMSEAKGTYE